MYFFRILHSKRELKKWKRGYMEKNTTPLDFTLQN